MGTLTGISRHKWQLAGIGVAFITGLMLVLPAIHDIIHTQLTSDAFYLQTIYKDIFADSVSLRGWNATEDRAIFPDAVLFFPSLAAFKDTGYAFLGFALAMAGLLAASIYLLSGLVERKTLPRLWTAVLSVLVIDFFLRQSPYFMHWFFIPGFHGGPYLLGLFLLATHAHWLKTTPRRIEWAAIFLLELIGCFSDAILFVQFLAPIAAVTLIGVLARRLHRNNLASNFAVPVGAYISSRILVSLLNSTGWLKDCVPLKGNLVHEFISFSWVGRVGNSLRDIQGIGWRSAGFMFCACLASVLAVTFLIIHESQARDSNAQCRSQSESRFLADSNSAKVLSFLLVFYIIHTLISAFAPGFLGRWEDDHSTRYVYPLYLSPIVFLAFSILKFRARIPRFASVALIVAVLQLGAFKVATEAAVFPNLTFALPYPDEIRCFDGLASTYGITRGYAGFFDASRITQHSRAGLRVLHMEGDLSQSFYFNNPNWYKPMGRSLASASGKGTPPPGWSSGSFVIADAFQADAIERKLGKPIAERRCGDKRVLVFNHSLE